ncbi:predicted protein [Naegleria gruberi]|uniref:Predicted protein n=1 Tax=Naegleria gruberi TaxID=5762 RepID=D2VZ35_NAEGR|nr:uncharacterized protein NAEGRDRAFT_74342 [Naegleria gruberi]EFC37874.1 predicted protein [Naegleria gruberi]|eukprot:XP_002670618.1 predicted protein [Naegleria gruberi strain NEG-M]
MIEIFAWIVIVIVLSLVASYHYYMNIRSEQPYLRKGSESLESKPIKIILHGPCASGKSTHSKELSKSLNIPVIDSDFHRFYPAHEFEWKNKSRAEFVAAVEKDMDQYREKGWVFDGRVLQLPSVVREANVLIMMDYALIVTYWRLLVRCVSRCISKTKCCNGNVERWTNQLGKDSLFVFEFSCMVDAKKQSSSSYFQSAFATRYGRFVKET